VHRDVARLLRENPQAAILLAICLVLGLGALIAIMISLATSGSNNVPAGAGPDSGVIALMHALY
jgi:hypothetical protein